MLLHKSKLSAYTVYLIFAALFNLSFSTIVTVNLVYQVEVAKLNPLQLVLVGTTLEVVAFLFQVPTVYLPSHDPEARERLFHRQTVLFPETIKAAL